MEKQKTYFQIIQDNIGKKQYMLNIYKKDMIYDKLLSYMKNVPITATKNLTTKEKKNIKNFLYNNVTNKHIIDLFSSEAIRQIENDKKKISNQEYIIQNQNLDKIRLLMLSDSLSQGQFLQIFKLGKDKNSLLQDIEQFTKQPIFQQIDFDKIRQDIENKEKEQYKPVNEDLELKQNAENLQQLVNEYKLEEEIDDEVIEQYIDDQMRLQIADLIDEVLDRELRIKDLPSGNGQFEQIDYEYNQYQEIEQLEEDEDQIMELPVQLPVQEQKIVIYSDLYQIQGYQFEPQKVTPNLLNIINNKNKIQYTQKQQYYRNLQQQMQQQYNFKYPIITQLIRDDIDKINKMNEFNKPKVKIPICNC